MTLKSKVKEIFRLTQEHHAWRRSCLNMISSESLTSPLVEALLASDFSRRYSSNQFYAGNRYYLSIAEIVEDLAKRAYKAKYIELRPATGNMTLMGVVCGLTKPGDKLTQPDPQWGGYAFRMAEWAKIRVVYYPHDEESLDIILQGACDVIQQIRPQLVIVGASELMFSYPLRELSGIAHDVGAVVYYDGSHVMGLILGGYFQKPFDEGADVLAGSTHKTIFGSQRGVIATNREDVYQRIAKVFDSPPFLVSCYHLNTLVALGAALAEMLEFGGAYADQVIRNAVALARTLDLRGVKLRGTARGFTQSHQVILNCGPLGSPEAQAMKVRLEQAGIIADQVVRFGVQELTRLGMKEGEMHQAANLIADVIQETRPLDAVRADVTELASCFQQIQYSFCDGEQAYAFLGARAADLLA